MKDNTPQNAIVFMLLEKRDRPNPDDPSAFVRINASNNVYQAWGSFLENPVYQWAAETNAGLLGLNQHVSYIHSKFLLIDPLGADPIVVTGSANFSQASTNENDENMIVVRGDRRVADIYFTEFNRLFNHYYFRSVTEITAGEPQSVLDASLFLAEDESLAGEVPARLATRQAHRPLRVDGGLHPGVTVERDSPREYSAGPKTTRTAKSSTMSTKRCSSPAGTNATSPGPSCADPSGVDSVARPCVTT